jgi:hypothetical protein
MKSALSFLSERADTLLMTPHHRTAFYVKPARLFSSSIEPQAPQASLMLQSTGLLPPSAIAGAELCVFATISPFFVSNL